MGSRQWFIVGSKTQVYQDIPHLFKDLNNNKLSILSLGNDYVPGLLWNPTNMSE